jgi:TonB family protein
MLRREPSRMMRTRASWCAVLVLVLAAAPVAAMADDCPISISTFWIAALGTTQHYAQYKMDMHTAIAGKYAARLSVIGTTADMKHWVRVAPIDFSDKHELVVFAWPTATLAAIELEAVTPAGGATMACTNAAPVAAMNASDDVKATFDDNGVTWPQEVVATGTPFLVRLDSQILHKVEPVYPQIEREALHQGNAVVSVTIGPDGQVVTVAVYKSSGYPELDKAAMDAARQSTYSSPTVNGSGIFSTYLQEYDFQLK